MPSFYIWTIGCQMNQAESERLEALLESRGYLPVPGTEEADLIIINSCVVRRSAENRALNKLMLLRHLKKKCPEKKVALTGCLVSDDLEALKQQYPFVDHFFKAGEKFCFEGITDSDPGELPAQASVSSPVTIIQGCNNYCTYCIVPYRRGREKSRPPAEIAREAETLVVRGAREIVLLGQNVDSYGQDLPEKPDLANLLEMLNGINGLWRIRFLTSHPKDMSLRLIEAIASLDKVCEKVNLPVQAGDDEILAAMGRGYTAEQYITLVESLRKAVPEIALTTDVIVGFPGEDERRFNNTLRLLRRIRFDGVHAAMYSPRPETLAAKKFVDDVSKDEKKRRVKLVEEMQAEIAGVINARLAGQKQEVLVEGRKKGRWYGRSRSDKLVFFEHSGNWSGRLAPVTIENTSPWSLKGRIKQ